MANLTQEQIRTIDEALEADDAYWREIATGSTDAERKEKTDAIAAARGALAGILRGEGQVGEWCDQFNALCQEWVSGSIVDGPRAIAFMRRMCAVIGTTIG